MSARRGQRNFLVYFTLGTHSLIEMLDEILRLKMQNACVCGAVRFIGTEESKREREREKKLCGIMEVILDFHCSSTRHFECCQKIIFPYNSHDEIITYLITKYFNLTISSVENLRVSRIFECINLYMQWKSLKIKFKIKNYEISKSIRFLVDDEQPYTQLMQNFMIEQRK